MLVDASKALQRLKIIRAMIPHNLTAAIRWTMNNIRGQLLSGKFWQSGAPNYKWPTFDAPAGKGTGKAWNLTWTGAMKNAMSKSGELIVKKSDKDPRTKLSIPGTGPFVSGFKFTASNMDAEMKANGGAGWFRWRIFEGLGKGNSYRTSPTMYKMAFKSVSRKAYRGVMIPADSTHKPHSPIAPVYMFRKTGNANRENIVNNIKIAIHDAIRGRRRTGQTTKEGSLPGARTGTSRGSMIASSYDKRKPVGYKRDKSSYDTSKLHKFTKKHENFGNYEGNRAPIRGHDI